MKTLMDIHLGKTGKFSDKWEIYLEHYERLFKPYRNKPIHLAEIGVQNGGSLETWAEYFPKAKRIVGVEIDPKFSGLTFDKPIELHIQDGKTPVLGSYDIVIDDGSHISDDMVSLFKAWWPLVKTGGLYIVEDLHTMWMPGYGTGAHMFFANMVNDVNREFSGQGYDISGLEFYNSMVVIHKGPSFLGHRLRCGTERLI